MLDLIKQCKNKKCPRFNIMFQPQENAKYCIKCGSKLKRWTEMSNNQQQDYNLGRQIASAHLLPGFVHGGLVETVKEKEAFVGESNCDVKGCPVAPNGKVTVEIPWPLFNQWLFLCQQFDVEWIAYLRGRLEEGVYKVDADGMHFPEQVATGAHVEAADNSLIAGSDIIAAVHSHVDMAAFFSGEDEKHFNHPVELVVNRKGNVEGMVRMKLECGRYQRVKAKVLLTAAADALSAQDALNKVLTVEQTVVTTYPKEWSGKDRPLGYGGVD